MVGFISADGFQIEAPTIRGGFRRINCHHALPVCGVSVLTLITGPMIPFYRS